MRREDANILAAQEIDAVDARHLGRRLHALREEQDWTLDALASRTGVSKAMLSKIERGENNPTLLVSAKIAGAFGLTISQLVGVEERRLAMKLPKSKQTIFHDAATGMERRSFPAFGGNAIDIVRVVMPAGADTGDLAPHLNALECYLLIDQGSLQVTMGADTFDLDEGDAFYFVANVPHRYRNNGRIDCRYTLIGHGHN